MRTNVGMIPLTLAMLPGEYEALYGEKIAWKCISLRLSPEDSSQILHHMMEQYQITELVCWRMSEDE